MSLAGDGAVVPQVCACCGVDAVRSILERRGPLQVFIPYCDPCLIKASAGFTRNLATTLSAVLAGGAVALALPIWSPHVSLPLHVAVTFLAGFVPVLLRAVLAPKTRSGHSASGRAAWWQGDGTLACTHPEFATALGRANAVDVRPARVREPRVPLWLLFVPIFGAGLAPFGHRLHHPVVRVVNLGPERILLSVDGHDLTTVEPSSTESSAAGRVTRLPAGQRTLTVSSDVTGQVLSEVTVTVIAGAIHLFAPGSAGTCFWLEETHYGRASVGPELLEPLDGASRFWTLSRAVDTWFSPNPTPEADGRSSGGTLVALRQAPCHRAPRGGGGPTDQR